MNNKIKVPQNVIKTLFGDNDSNSLINQTKLMNSIMKHNRILVQGEVQSGKTGNLIQLVETITKRKPYIIVYLTGRKNNLLFQNYTRFFKYFNNLNKNNIDKKYMIVNKERHSDANIILIKNFLNKGITYIINELKIPLALDNLYKILKDIKCDVLIIDDEADEASLAEITRKKILKMTSLENVKYIAITATPYNNLYYYENFYNDFIILDSLLGYNGINDFWNNIKEVDDINSIKETIIKPLIKWASISLKIKKENKTQILFNLSLFTKEHLDIRKKILSFLKNELNILFKKEVITKEVFDFLTEIDDNNIILSNSAIDKSKAFIQNTEINNGRKIIIGGGNLSRGISYENLIVEVMLNSTEIANASILLQRARWFGYKNELKEHMKIYLTKNIKKSFKEINDLNEWTKKYKLGSGYKKEFDSKEYKNIRI